MRRGYRQLAAVLVGEVLRSLFEVVRFVQNAVRNFDDRLARRRDGRNPFAIPHENFHTKFVFQQLDLFADAGLGRVQFVGGNREIQALPLDLHQIA